MGDRKRGTKSWVLVADGVQVDRTKPVVCGCFVSVCGTFFLARTDGPFTFLSEVWGKMLRHSRQCQTHQASSKRHPGRPNNTTRPHIPNSLVVPGKATRPSTIQPRPPPAKSIHRKQNPLIWMKPGVEGWRPVSTKKSTMLGARLHPETLTNSKTASKTVMDQHRAAPVDLPQRRVNEVNERKLVRLGLPGVHPRV